MDNLTHSLAGAVLGQMGLKKKTGLAMPTLIIAANIPDIDAIATLFGNHTYLGIRRGITHGPIAMLLLPLLLWAFMISYDRWQGKRGKRPESRLPIDRKWLLILAFIGTLSHPALDWMNSYGVRLLEPFSSQWFYGDTLFIIDLNIWIALAAGVFWSLRKEKKGLRHYYQPALISCAFVVAYISGNFILSRHVVALTESEVGQSIDRNQIKQIVANPVPFAFWKREVILGGPNDYYQASYSLFDDRPILDDSYPIEIARHAPAVENLQDLAVENTDLTAFLFWARMPYHGIIREDGNAYAIIGDARFTSSYVEERFKVKVKLEKDVQFVAK